MQTKNIKKKTGTKEAFKIDKKFAIILILFVVSLIILGMIINDILTNGEREVAGDNRLIIEIEAEEENKTIETEELPSICLERYEIEDETVLFIYSDSCSYSIAMKPIVSDLEQEGYKFFWANIENGSAMGIVTTCLLDVVQLIGTPEFICPKLKESKAGQISKNDLKLFVSRCMAG